ncbi:unnamed protein product [Auanema sp. JU1783]|nr:unnamed protein product [Auanema sp. JU1783]
MDDPPTPSSKKPLPKYTSIDLESELPDIFSTSLNPNVQDPDLTLFYSQRDPPFYNYKKRNSPPPSYPPSNRSFSTSTAPLTNFSSNDRKRFWFVAIFSCLVICPLIIFILFNWFNSHYKRNSF